MRLYFTTMFFADTLADLGLRPWGHVVHQYLSHTPDAIGQARRHRRRPRLPALTGFHRVHPIGQRQAQARVGQHEIGSRTRDLRTIF
jgi:hypothetical protein